MDLNERFAYKIPFRYVLLLYRMNKKHSTSLRDCTNVFHCKNGYKNDPNMCIRGVQKTKKFSIIKNSSNFRPRNLYRFQCFYTL